MTELGEIPHEWEVNNGFIKIKSGFGFKLREYELEGIPLIRINNVMYGEIINEDLCYLPCSYLNNYKEFVLKKGDVLLALNRPITNNKLKIGKITEGPSILYQRVGKLEMDGNRYHSDFYFHYMQSESFINRLNNSLVGTDQPYIKTSEFENLKFVVPTLEEQEKIASILSTVDEQINNVEALIKKNKELKKGLMQTLLTKGIGHTKFKKTEIGEIPEEWEVKRVGDITEIKTGGTPSTKCEEYWKDGRIPWMVSGDVNKGIINSVDGRITESGMNNSAAKLLPKDTVMIALNGQGKTKGTVAYLNIEVTCNQSLAGFLPKEEKFYSKYLFYNLQNRYSEIRGLTGDGARNGLNLGILRDILIPLPSIEEQRRTASILSQIDEKIEEYENKKQKLEEIKKGLMQQLLTGKLRVK